MTILIWIVTALGVVCIALAVLHIVALRKQRMVRSQRDRLNTESEQAQNYYKQVVANQEKAYQQLEGERNALKIENGKLHETLAKARAEVERLNKPDLATLPLTEAVTQEPPKKVTRQKRGGPA